MIAKAKADFIEKSSGKLAEIVESTITTELGMLKEDIKSAKENMFGRKIFETFAAEFMGSHLAEGTHISKLSTELLDVKTQLEESQKEITDREAKIEEATKEVAAINESRARETAMAELLAPLSQDKRKLMSNLLESVNTTKLKAAFNKYLPTVLNETVKKTEANKTQLNETQKTEITGDKAATTQETSSEAEIINLKKLAGIITN